MYLLNKWHKQIKVLMTSLAVILVIYPGVCILGASAAMQIPRLPVTTSPSSVGLPYRNVSFPSRDNIMLSGWFIPSNSPFALVLIHGGFQNRVDPTIPTLDLSHDLFQKGYNVLLFDMRGRGQSEGIGYSLSNADKDIGGALDYLKTLGYRSGQIGIIGFCSGAADTCVFASREHVGAVVLDGCFTGVKDMVNNQAAYRGIPRIFADIFLPGVQLAARVFYGYKAVNPIDVVGKVTCPILYIREENDELVSSTDGERLISIAGNPANRLWQADNTYHSRAYETLPAEYVTQIDNFFRTNLAVMNR